MWEQHLNEKIEIAISGIFITYLFFYYVLMKINRWKWNDLVENDVKYSKETASNKWKIYYKTYGCDYVVFMLCWCYVEAV